MSTPKRKASGSSGKGQKKGRRSGSGLHVPEFDDPELERAETKNESAQSIPSLVEGLVSNEQNPSGSSEDKNQDTGTKPGSGLPPQSLPRIRVSSVMDDPKVGRDVDDDESPNINRKQGESIAQPPAANPNFLSARSKGRKTSVVHSQPGGSAEEVGNPSKADIMPANGSPRKVIMTDESTQTETPKVVDTAANTGNSLLEIEKLSPSDKNIDETSSKLSNKKNLDPFSPTTLKEKPIKSNTSSPKEDSSTKTDMSRGSKGIDKTKVQDDKISRVGGQQRVVDESPKRESIAIALAPQPPPQAQKNSLSERLSKGRRSSAVNSQPATTTSPSAKKASDDKSERGSLPTTSNKVARESVAKRKPSRVSMVGVGSSAPKTETAQRKDDENKKGPTRKSSQAVPTERGSVRKSVLEELGTSVNIRKSANNTPKPVEKDSKRNSTGSSQPRRKTSLANTSNRYSQSQSAPKEHGESPPSVSEGDGVIVILDDASNFRDTDIADSVGNPEPTTTKKKNCTDPEGVLSFLSMNGAEALDDCIIPVPVVEPTGNEQPLAQAGKNSISGRSNESSGKHSQTAKPEKSTEPKKVSRDVAESPKTKRGESIVVQPRAASVSLSEGSKGRKSSVVHSQQPEESAKTITRDRDMASQTAISIPVDAPFLSEKLTGRGIGSGHSLLPTISSEEETAENSFQQPTDDNGEESGQIAAEEMPTTDSSTPDPDPGTGSATNVDRPTEVKQNDGRDKSTPKIPTERFPRFVVPDDDNEPIPSDDDGSPQTREDPEVGNPSKTDIMHKMGESDKNTQVIQIDESTQTQAPKLVDNAANTGNSLIGMDKVSTSDKNSSETSSKLSKRSRDDASSPATLKEKPIQSNTSSPKDDNSMRKSVQPAPSSVPRERGESIDSNALNNAFEDFVDHLFNDVSLMLRGRSLTDAEKNGPISVDDSTQTEDPKIVSAPQTGIDKISPADNNIEKSSKLSNKTRDASSPTTLNEKPRESNTNPKVQSKTAKTTTSPKGNEKIQDDKGRVGGQRRVVHASPKTKPGESIAQQHQAAKILTHCVDPQTDTSIPVDTTPLPETLTGRGITCCEHSLLPIIPCTCEDKAENSLILATNDNNGEECCSCTRPRRKRRKSTPDAYPVPVYMYPMPVPMAMYPVPIAMYPVPLPMYPVPMPMYLAHCPSMYSQHQYTNPWHLSHPPITLPKRHPRKVPHHHHHPHQNTPGNKTDCWEG